MTRAQKRGLLVPLIVSAFVMGLTQLAAPLQRFQSSMAVGLAIGLAQSFLSTWMLQRAWKTPYFYWVWGGGLAFRFFIFVGTAYVVYAFTLFHLVATLLTLVSATTLFLVVEYWSFFNKQNGFSTSS